MHTNRDKSRLLFTGLSLIALTILGVLLARFTRSSGSEIRTLYQAAGSGNIDLVKEFIRKGDDLNEAVTAPPGWTPLIVAAFHNQTNIVHILLEAGANPDAADDEGKTPLMWVTAHGDTGLDTVNDLITHGANLFAADKEGATAFSYAKSDPPKPRIIEALEWARLNKEATNSVR